MKCRHCSTKLKHAFVDLGSAPPSNSYLSEMTLWEPEKWYPLKILVCDQCWLVQTEDFVAANELFSAEYAYFSSYSRLWVEHAKTYAKDIISRLQLSSAHTVVEIAANDGYLLQHFQQQRIPCYGVEPTSSTAMAAKQKGIDIIEDFFGLGLANQLIKNERSADLMVANNVLAHVPDINDFVQGFSILLTPPGVATFEFPYLLQLVKNNQFDTIYHEHFSYLSLTAVNTIFRANGLTIFDVEELTTHGGSLRIYAQRKDHGQRPVTKRFKQLVESEERAGMTSINFYRGFQKNVEELKFNFLEFLIRAKREGKKVAAYGAAAKGSTLLNFSGIRADLISYVVDQNPMKQGKYMPGSRLPIVNEAHLKTDRPDYLIILPWNLKTEITTQLAYLKQWGTKIVTAIPSLEIS